MATVVTNGGQAGSQGFNFMDGISSAITSLPVLIFLGLICGVITVVVVIWFNLRNQEINREAEDRVYATYKKHKRTCLSQVNPHWVKKQKTMKTYIFGCFGMIPIFERDLSYKIVDKNDNLIGYYRGEHMTKEGEMIYAITRKKKLFIIEEIELLRCLHSFNSEVPVDKNDPDKGTKVTKINFDMFYKEYPEKVSHNNKKELKIKCYTFEEQGYYLVPNYISETTEGTEFVVDTRGVNAENLRSYTMDVSYNRLLADTGNAIDKVARINPHNAVDKYSREKTEEDVRRDDELGKSM